MGYDAPMNQTTAPCRDQLKSIARRAMLQRGLLPDFSAAVVAETGSIANAAAASDPSLKDLRHLLWASIDNDDSLDLDQLSVAEQLPDGAVKILVAIADVDAIVKKGSAIDGHARTNTTSVYTAAEIFPMLPEKLSTDLTSLADGKERLAIVIEMEVGADGAVGKSDIYRAVVVNRAKLAYNSVAAWLDRHCARARADNKSIRPRPESPPTGSRRAGDENAAASAGRVVAGDYRGSPGVRRRFVERSAGGPEESRDRADRRLHDRCERCDGEIPRAEGFSGAAPGSALARAMGANRRAGEGRGRASSAAS